MNGYDKNDYISMEAGGFQIRMRRYASRSEFYTMVEAAVDKCFERIDDDTEVFHPEREEFAIRSEFFYHMCESDKDLTEDDVWNIVFDPDFVNAYEEIGMRYALDGAVVMGVHHRCAMIEASQSNKVQELLRNMEEYTNAFAKALDQFKDYDTSEILGIFKTVAGLDEEKIAKNIWKLQSADPK